tara:strand:- start:14 stop:304 length:291 start_codon:yes stop_codon:yes gene_type:complete
VFPLASSILILLALVAVVAVLELPLQLDDVDALPLQLVDVAALPLQLDDVDALPLQLEEVAALPLILIPQVPEALPPVLVGTFSDARKPVASFLYW